MPTQPPVLLVASDTASLNANNLELSALSQRLPARVVTSSYEPDPIHALALIDSADYVVYKDGGEPESPFFNRYRSALLAELGRRTEFSEINLPVVSPDGGRIHLFRLRANVRRLRPGLLLESGLIGATALEAAPADAQFGDVFRLAGLAFERTRNGLRVAYKWRCTRKPDRNYWCFTHVLGSDHQIVGYLDHAILASLPEIRPGDVRVEELQWKSPDKMPANFQLRLGVFDPVSGERLRIGGAPRSDTLALAVTDAGTALSATAAAAMSHHD
jgi:hypothetical protein